MPFRQLLRFTRLDGDTLTLHSSRAGFQGSMIGQLPAEIGHIIVIGGVDDQTMVTLIGTHIEQPVTAVVSNLQPEHLLYVDPPAAQVGRVGARVGQFRHAHRDLLRSMRPLAA